ncbi:MAG: glycosyltransferase [Parvibaculum sp.]|nr:glycosyltransferase [Parvibaculum sp.]
MSIPKIIHQLWKDDAPPARYLKLIESWRLHHPTWEYRFWTDTSLRAFVAATYPAFLPIYDGYEKNICRADAGRYLLLSHFGGLYADLDAEALRPFDDLIESHDFVIGLEPSSHLSHKHVSKLGLDHLLCPTIIASMPAHPFWNDVMRTLRARPKSFDVLELTGPAMLTRVHDAYKDTAPVTVMPSETFYPLTKDECWRGDAFNIEVWEEKTRTAYALHYWDGTWFRESSDDLPALPSSFPLTLTEGAPGDRPRRNDRPPLITCMMVTRDRFHLARHALKAFLNQTYKHIELVIIDDGTCTKLANEVTRLNDPRVRFIRPVTDNMSLGRLRNLAVENARGDYVCQWDDDDLSDPCRLEIQLASLIASGARASFLTRWLIWQPQKKRMIVSPSRAWEGSMLCEREIMPRYDDLRRGEDTPVAEAICARYKVAHLDIPRLYIYIGHGSNTFDSSHFDDYLRTRGKKFEGARYEVVVRELGKRINLNAYSASLASAPELPALNIFGMFNSGTGLGSGARGLAAATKDIPHTLIDLQNLPDETTRDWQKLAPHGTNILYTNPDLLDLFLKRKDGSLDMSLFEGRRTIGLWAFESAILPDNWLKWLPHFDEIWAPSQFVADCLTPHISVPVFVIPMLEPPLPPIQTRAALNLPAQSFIFLTLFDELSGFTRKNPLGTIDAYISAFPSDDGKTHLVIKARSLSPERQRKLKEKINDRADITLRIGETTQSETASYIAHCDALVSLHRAEGFGLVMAEAMQHGKPVIATGWSGNLEFMPESAAYLVRYHLTTLTEHTDNAYATGTQWAEPDLDHAASLMRALVTDPEAARTIGARAKDFITTELTPEKIGTRIVARLIKQRVVPSVLILTPVKNAAKFLVHYFELLSRLDHDKSKISLGFIEGDSTDTTYANLAARLPALTKTYANVTLIKHDEGLTFAGPRWAQSIQRARRATLARARNRLLSAALRDEAWVLWLDVDLIDYPANLLARLIAADKDIIVPRCTLPDGRDYDLNSFRFEPSRGSAENPDHLIDSIYQPPRGAGRAYLGDLVHENGAVPIDGVGGTALLIKADRHREGLNFPSYSHRGYIETEGLAMIARDMGIMCWALPELTIIHTDE